MSVLSLFKGGTRDLWERPPDNVPALDILRSAAILLVFTAHFGGLFDASPRVAKLPPFYFGWSGVDLFFVLSGLLIGTQLWRELRQSGGIHIRRFLLRRGLRIWPLYFGFIGAVAIGDLIDHRPMRSIGADVFFVSNYFHGQIAGGWSLSTEEQFYIFAPVAIATLALILKPKHFWILPALGIVVPAIARKFYIVSSSLPEADLRQQLYFPIHTHSEGLAVGVLLAWINVFHGQWLTRWKRGIIAVAMLIAGCMLYVSSHLWFNFTALALIFGAAVCYGAELRTKSAILNWYGFYLISRLSYGIYLNHFVVLPLLHSLLGSWRNSSGEAAFWGCYVISFLGCMIFAMVTFQLIEWPFLQLRSRWLRATRARPTELKSAYVAEHTAT